MIRSRRVPFALLAALPAIASVIASGPRASRADEPKKRTLAELIELAKARAPTVQAAAAQIDVRQAQRSGAIDNWFPRGDITGTMTLSTTIRCQDASGNASTTQCVSTNIGTVYTATPSGIGGEINLQLTQPLYTFGKIEHGTKAADYGITVEKQRVEIARREAELQATRAYWGLKAARTAMVTAEDGRSTLVEWVRKIEDDLDRDKPQYSFGINDLQRLKVAVSQVDLIVADLSRNENIARQGLRAVVGEETDVDDSELEPVEIVDKPLEYYQSEALANRPEIKALDAGVMAKRELAKLKIAEMLPDLALVGNVGYRKAMNVDDPQNAFLNHFSPGFIWGGALAFRQPIDLVEKHAKYREARADASALEADRRLALTGIGFEIAQAYENLGEARRRLAAAEKGQSTARGWLNATRQNVDLGTADARDLVDAARAYYELRLRYYQAIYDVNYQVAVLRRAAGVEIARAPRKPD